jgi:hypothetical protein
VIPPPIKIKNLKPGMMFIRLGMSVLVVSVFYPTCSTCHVITIVASDEVDEDARSRVHDWGHCEKELYAFQGGAWTRLT